MTPNDQRKEDERQDDGGLHLTISCECFLPDESAWQTNPYKSFVQLSICSNWLSRPRVGDPASLNGKARQKSRLKEAGRKLSCAVELHGLGVPREISRMAARKEPGDGTPGSFPSRFGSKAGEIRSQIQPLSAETELSDEEKDSHANRLSVRSVPSTTTAAEKPDEVLRS